MHTPFRFFPQIISVTGVLLLLMAGTAWCETGYQDSGPFSMNTAGLSAVDDFVPIALVDQLAPCHPNPFNPRTPIKYQLASPGEVHLAVYDLKGRLVQILQSGIQLPPGSYEASWDGRNSRGQTVAGSIYLCRMTVGKFTASQRMTLIK